MRKKYAPEHVMIRDGVYYYVRHIPCDLAPIYSVTRLCFSLKTKSLKAAIRTSKSVTQRLEDYWLGLKAAEYGYTCHSGGQGNMTNDTLYVYLKPVSYTFG